MSWWSKGWFWWSVVLGGSFGGSGDGFGSPGGGFGGLGDGSAHYSLNRLANAISNSNRK